MAIANHERVGKALDLLKVGLLPFVQRERQVGFGTKCEATARVALGGPTGHHGAMLG